MDIKREREDFKNIILKKESMSQHNLFCNS